MNPFLSVHSVSGRVMSHGSPTSPEYLLPARGFTFICPVGLSGQEYALMRQKGLESHPSSYLQLCDLGQVTFLCLNSFPSFVTFRDCCVLVERMRRERLENATQEPGAGKHAECSRVSNGYCSISLDFLWEEII